MVLEMVGFRKFEVFIEFVVEIVEKGFVVDWVLVCNFE